MKDKYLSREASEGKVFLTSDQLVGFQALFSKGLFETRRYNFNTYSARINNHVYIRCAPHYMGGIWLGDMLYPLSILLSYDPFWKILYISDDEFDDYGNGLVISNIPSAMLHYRELNTEYPDWMDADVSHLKQDIMDRNLNIGIKTFHPKSTDGLPFLYLVPYLSATFGTNICLKSDTLFYDGPDFVYVPPTNAHADFGRTKHDLELIVGDTTLHVDDKRYLEESFFDELTNAMIRAVDQLRARP